MSEDWWDAGPVFSTTDHGARITVVPPGRPIGRLRARHVLTIIGVAVVCAVAMTLALPASIPPITFGLGFGLAALWWWIPVTVIAVFVMVEVVTRFFRATNAEFQSTSVALRAITAAVTAGLAAAFLTWSWLLRRSEGANAFADDVQPAAPWAAAGFAVVALVALSALPLAARRASRRAQVIVALRDRGARCRGEIIDIPDPKLWLLGRPQFPVTVRYENGDGEHTLEASMSTRPERVPVHGSPVLVFVGADGSTYVEVDADNPMTFATKTSRYHASADGGT